MSATEVVKQFCKLPFEEQQAAFVKIREVIREFDDELTPEQANELDRRLEKYEQNPNDGAPWDEVKARLQKQREHRK